MSSGPAFVRFPDGTVRHCTYHGTSDVLTPGLFDTATAASEAHYGHSPSLWPPECDCGPVPVTVWTLYGGGFGWEARACEHRVHGQLMPWGHEHYFTGEVIEPPVDEIKVAPEWVADLLTEDGWVAMNAPMGEKP